jgi:hypothetical protein
MEKIGTQSGTTGTKLGNRELLPSFGSSLQDVVKRRVEHIATNI